ncbi:MAG: FAD-dependent oxidoreductase [Ilumatobacteraceae bacterium]
MEFGQIFRRLGSDVTILEASGHLMPCEDDDIAHAAEEILVSEGVTVRTDAKVSSVAQPELGRAEVSFTVDGDTETITGSHSLLAVGRVPNTAALHLDAAGVQTDQRGYVRVDDVLRTNVEHIYAFGDVNGRGVHPHVGQRRRDVLGSLCRR